MRRFMELCIKVKIIAVEVAGLGLFLSTLAGLFYWEWQHVLQFVRR